MTGATVRAMLIASLAPLAAARELAVSTVEIPAPRPASDLCPTCGGSMRNHPAWINYGERCGSAWHCEHPSNNHSGDRVTVYDGSGAPRTVCGYHAQYHH